MSKDRWVLVQDDGTIILREENDGWHRRSATRLAQLEQRVTALEQALVQLKA